MDPTTPTEPRNDRGKRNSRQEAEPDSVLPEAAGCKVDPDNVLGIVGIVSTFLNLLVVVLVYIYTAI